MNQYIGKRLDGRYEILELIGIGGMADVYLADDITTGRKVAVKILKEEYLTNEDFKRRFRNESKAIALLSHPNIVKIYDVSFGERVQFIVMEYVPGITLKEYIQQQGKVGWKETVHFTVQILRALQHAHDNGIVHPGREAPKRHAAPGRHREGDGLRHRSVCPRKRPDHFGKGHRFGALYLPGTGPWRGGGRAQRHLFRGHRHVRAAHRPASL